MNNIRKMRIDLNLSQTDLSLKTGIPNNTLSQYENDKRIPKIDKLILIAKVLNCSLDELIKKEIADEVCDTTAISETDK